MVSQSMNTWEMRLQSSKLDTLGTSSNVLFSEGWVLRMYHLGLQQLSLVLRCPLVWSVISAIKGAMQQGGASL